LVIDANPQITERQTYLTILCLDYEPGVVTQMLEYSYRYITSVLEDARLYANHARYRTYCLLTGTRIAVL
jgi:hypothetical protein